MKKLLECLRKLNLPKGKYAIFGSGPMGIRGLRGCRDLDVIVMQDLFDALKENPDFKTKEFQDFQYLEKDGIEFLKDWEPGEWNIEKLIQESEIIDGFPFVKLEEVLRWKKIKQRDKDIKDIELIEEYLRKT